MNLRASNGPRRLALILLLCGAYPAMAQNPPVYQFLSSANFNGAPVTGAGGEGCIAGTANPSNPFGSQYIPNLLQNCTIGSSLTQTQSLNGSLGQSTITGSATQSASPAQVSASVTTTALSGPAYANSVAYYHQDGLPAVAGQTLNFSFLVLSSVTNQGLASSVIVALTSDTSTVQSQLSAPLSPAFVNMSPLLIGPSGKFSITVNVLAVQNGGPGTDSLTVYLGCNLPVTGVTYACDQSVYNSLPGSVCDTLNSTIAGLYNNAFTNANACIYVQLGSASPAQSVSQPFSLTYSAFRGVLLATQLDANDNTAVTASVPSANPFSGANIRLTNPLARAFSSSVLTGIMPNGQTPCALGTVGCYDGIVTIGSSVPLFFRNGSITPSQYDFFTLVERQTDEILGTASCSPGTCSGSVAPADLFRYHSSGTRSFTAGTNNSCSTPDNSNACFSLDGVHMLQHYDNLSGQDTGDWAPNCASPLVQDISGCPGVSGVDISPSAEVLVLDVVGYTLNLTSNITIQTHPSGLPFTVDGGAAQNAPQTLHLAPGTHTIAVSPTLPGSPGSQYVFSGWSDGGAATHSITATSNTAATYTANFDTQYQLTVATSPAAGGTVTPASAAFYTAGTAAPVAATAGSGYAFSGWTGPVANASNASTTVTMSAPESVTANFTPLTAITIQTNPASLQFSVDGGPAQTAPQTVSLAPGAHTIAAATTQAGATGTQYVFASWSDSGAASHSITVGSSAATYTATFNTQYQLTVLASPTAGGSVTPSSGGFYNSGAVVSITASANAGYQFSGWSGPAAVPAAASTTVTMSAAETVTANFSALAGITLQTNPTGLQIAVDGGPAQTAPQTLSLASGSHSIAVANTQSGAPGTQYTFLSWSDSGAASHTITVGSSAATYTATFQTQYQLTVAASPAAGGTVTPSSGFFNAGSVVPIAATANSGYQFTNWTGPAANPTAASTTVTLSAPASLTATFSNGPTGLAFFPVTPCRVVDTRPSQTIATNTTRTISVTGSPCNIPAAAQAYSLNVTVVPAAGLNYVTIWPTGQTQPFVSTLNSLDGRVVANAAIVPAGANGSVDVYASNATDVILDINGYFAPPAGQSLLFYPVTPCRVVDTRGATGAFGAPSLAAGVIRAFTLPSGPCGIPTTAQAYSLNVTVVPQAPLGYLTVWPAGQSQPLVSTLNSYDGSIVANAAIVPAGSGTGAIDVYATGPTDLILDINGYFAPAGASGALKLYTLAPCRVADTRNATGAFGGPALPKSGTRTFQIPASTCGVPASAQAFAFNATVVPTASLGYLTAWPAGLPQPVVSTLNSLAGKVVANAAIVPAGASPAGGVSFYASDATNLVLDINAYFAQ